MEEVNCPSYHFLFLSILTWAGVVGGAKYLSVFPIVSSSARGDLDMSFLCLVFPLRAPVLTTLPMSFLSICYWLSYSSDFFVVMPHTLAHWALSSTPSDFQDSIPFFQLQT